MRYTTAVACLLFAGSFVLRVQAQPKPHPKSQPRIQVAILLDVSGSMEGLIDQARMQLWSTVRLLGNMECTGGRPRVEIAVFAYGQEINASGGYITLVQPFTNSLDSLSGALFQLKAKGSDEFCGLAIHRALTELNWDPAASTYKAIFIAGNESFEEGPFSPAEACAEATRRGVIVNTIFCGPESDTKFYNWNVGATCGGGSYMLINQNFKPADIETPLIKISSPGTTG
jgi:hypothetical protein